MNLRLKYAIDKAKADNMPKDNIERAIKKGSGDLGSESYESVTYEGYLAGGVAVLIDVLTDNRNRTAPELRTLLEKKGGNLAVGGAVAWMFEQKAVFRVPAAGQEEDALLEIAAEVGAEDVRTEDGTFEVLADPRSFAEIREALKEHDVEVESAEIIFVPKNSVEVTDESVAQKVLGALDELENNEDVQNTYANFEMSEELLGRLQ
jgi:YebC/PmpR family DNA-binding regulatory protein